MAEDDPTNLTAAKLIDLSERICPWAKYRDRADLIPVEDSRTDLPDVTVAGDGRGRRLVFAKVTAIQTIRNEWAGREIDSIPSDEEIAAWLAWAAVEGGGDQMIEREVDYALRNGGIVRNPSGGIRTDVN
jgi:hypothetical protein